MGKCLGHFALGRYLAQELPAEEQREVAAHLTDCERCRSLVHEIEQDRAEYAGLGSAHYQAAWQRAAGSQGQPARPRPALIRPGFWKILLPVAAGAAAALLLVPRLAPTPRPPAASVGYKGSLALEIVAKRSERQFIVSDNARLCPGDELRFTITAADEKSYVVIFSVDQAGTLSAFYPNEATPPALRAGGTITLTRPGRHVLPGSIVLDQSQGREIIFLLAASSPFDPRPFQARIKEGAGASPGTVHLLQREKLGFSGTTRAVVIMKVPCP